MAVGSRFDSHNRLPSLAGDCAQNGNRVPSSIRGPHSFRAILLADVQAFLKLKFRVQDHGRELLLTDGFGTREELTRSARQNFTTNRLRLRCLSDEHGLVTLGLAARANVGT